ncbi:MAG: hypothetical protein HGA96_04105 [Desulfobulbaceae bacterium]|nr:hypothetical protein [Desulfobulbaceae bacterium]
MKKLVAGLLLVTLCNVVPLPAFSQEDSGNPPVTTVAPDNKVRVGVVAVVVSLLGLIALAASSGSGGDATPAATVHH